MGDVPLTQMPPKEFFDTPYQCSDESGRFIKCSKDRCGGRWKPPRTHHCSTCGVCKLDWDHHCPWIGNCVSKSQSRLFLRLLALTPVTILIIIIPIIHPLLFRHVPAAWKASRSDPETIKNWWNWYPWSWIVYGGPVGRYAIGIIRGFLVLQRRREGQTPETRSKLGTFVSEPRVGLLLGVSGALLLASFTTGLAAQMILNISRGEATLDIMKRKASSTSTPNDNDNANANATVHNPTETTRLNTSHPSQDDDTYSKPKHEVPLVWIPRSVFSNADLQTRKVSLSSDFKGCAVPLLRGERMYDLGRERNWRRFWGNGLSDAVEESWALNPVMIARMKKEALRLHGTVDPS